MKTTQIAFLLLLTYSSCSAGGRKSRLLVQTWTFENSTLRPAIEDVRENLNWDDYYSFRVRNDRKFERLVFKDVLTQPDLLREIEAKLDCQIIEAGHSAIIILPPSD
jgi:hypothetical protein